MFLSKVVFLHTNGRRKRKREGERKKEREGKSLTIQTFFLLRLNFLPERFCKVFLTGIFKISRLHLGREILVFYVSFVMCADLMRSDGVVRGWGFLLVSFSFMLVLNIMYSIRSGLLVFIAVNIVGVFDLCVFVLILFFLCVFFLFLFREW